MASFALNALLFFFFLFARGYCRVVNATIDDADIGPFPLGQARLASIAFYPSNNGMWGNQFGGTESNAITPEAVKAFQNTFTMSSIFAGNTARSIVIDFFGTSITAYLTLSNELPTECDVTLDGKQQFAVRHSAGSRNEDFSYQIPVLSYTDLPPGLHRLEIKVTPFDNTRLNYVNFDYAEYTYDTEQADAFLAQFSGLNPGVGRSSGVETSSGKDGSKLAAIISVTIGGSIIIAAIILVVYFRSRSRKQGVSSIESKINISQLGDTSDTGSKQPSVFMRTLRNTFSGVMSRTSLGRETTGKGLPVSISNWVHTRHSTASSAASSKGQPMYEEFGNASKWEELTSIASSPPQRHQIQSLGPAQVYSPEVEGRRKFSDNRLDSLGLHLTNIQPDMKNQNRSPTRGDLGSREGPVTVALGNPRDLTAPYQYSLRQPSPPSVHSLDHAM